MASRVPRWQGRKPPYTNPGTHDPSHPNFVRGKSSLPPDATEVYRAAIPDADACATGNQTWYGRNAQGEYYRYQGRGAVHWNGTVLWQDLSLYVKLRFIERGIRG